MKPTEYPMGPPAEATVEIDENSAGQTIYRHVIATEWQVAPDADPAELTPHYVVVNPDYDDEGRLRSWEVERCTCDRPWRHPHGIR